MQGHRTEGGQDSQQQALGTVVIKTRRTTGTSRSELDSHRPASQQDATCSAIKGIVTSQLGVVLQGTRNFAVGAMSGEQSACRRLRKVE